MAVVSEHGNAGAAAAAPVARDIMLDTLGRDPANRTHPPGAEVAQGPMPPAVPLGVAPLGATQGAALGAAPGAGKPR